MKNKTAWLIVNKNTWRVVSSKPYTSKGFAMRGIRAHRNADELEAMTHADWVAGDTLVPSTNLMSGKAIMVRRSELGGCCDPGAERYWSM